MSIKSLPAAVFCAAEHPFDPVVLCRCIDGHTGAHTADGAAPWADPEETHHG